MKGVLDKKYHLGRLNRIDYRYRLNRRTDEVLDEIKNREINSILDLGAAEGLMLSKIKSKHPLVKCVGVEYSEELISLNKSKDIELIKGDVQDLNFDDNQFDMVIATAVIEHLEEPDKLVSEAFRVLKKGGIFVVTTPNPFFDKIYELFTGGHDHQVTFNLKTLRAILEEGGFKILLAKRFMISPIGLPFEILVEKILSKLGLDFIFLNQKIVGMKK